MYQLAYRAAFSKLQKAASTGSVYRVQHILNSGQCFVNDRHLKTRRTALHYACASGQPKVVTVLLERKCDIDARDSDRSTALIQATKHQQPECVTILLDHGADPNLVDNNGNTALHYAVLNEDTWTAEKLLSQNSNIEARNKFALTPFLLALRMNKQRMIDFLLKKGADIHAVDARGRTSLMLAILCKSRHLVNLLLEQGVDVFVQDYYGWTALHYTIVFCCDKCQQLVVSYQNLQFNRYMNIALKDFIPEVTRRAVLDRPDGSKNNQLQVEEKSTTLRSDEEETENQSHGASAAADPSIQEKRIREPESPLFLSEETELDRPRKKTRETKHPVKKQRSAPSDIFYLTKSLEKAFEAHGLVLHNYKKSLGLIRKHHKECQDHDFILKILNELCSLEQLMFETELFRIKMKNELIRVKMELLKTKDVKHQFQQESEVEPSNLRPRKNTCKAKQQVSKQRSALNDIFDSTEPLEGASENSNFLPHNSKKILCLLKKHSKKCQDYDFLLNILSEFHSLEKYVYKTELLIIEMNEEVIRIQKEISEKKGEGKKDPLQVLQKRRKQERQHIKPRKSQGKAKEANFRGRSTKRVDLTLVTWKQEGPAAPGVMSHTRVDQGLERGRGGTGKARHRRAQSKSRPQGFSTKVHCEFFFFVFQMDIVRISTFTGITEVTIRGSEGGGAVPLKFTDDDLIMGHVQTFQRALTAADSLRKDRIYILGHEPLP